MQREPLANVRPPVYFTDHGVEELPWWEVLLRTLAVQFSLLSLLILVTIACIVMAIVGSLGSDVFFHLVISALVILPVLFVWSLCYGMAPEPTKYGTVLFVAMLLLLMPLPGLILHSREEARRAQCVNNLRQLGRELQQHQTQNPQANEDKLREVYAELLADFPSQ